MRSIKEKLPIILLMVTTTVFVGSFIYAAVTYVAGTQSMSASPDTTQKVNTNVNVKYEYHFKVNNNGPKTDIDVHRWYKLYGRNKNVVVINKTWCNTTHIIPANATNYDVDHTENYGSIYLDHTGRWHHEMLQGCPNVGLDNRYSEIWFKVEE